MANGNARLDGLNKIFWKKEVPSEEEILAIEAKGLGLSAKELAGGVITDDAAKAIGGFQKACRAGEQALQAFIAGWPAELQPILERLVPKPREQVVTVAPVTAKQPVPILPTDTETLLADTKLADTEFMEAVRVAATAKAEAAEAARHINRLRRIRKRERVEAKRRQGDALLLDVKVVEEPKKDEEPLPAYMREAEGRMKAGNRNTRAIWLGGFFLGAILFCGGGFWILEWVTDDPPVEESEKE